MIRLNYCKSTKGKPSVTCQLHCASERSHDVSCTVLARDHMKSVALCWREITWR